MRLSHASANSATSTLVPNLDGAGQELSNEPIEKQIHQLLRAGRPKNQLPIFSKIENSVRS